MPLSHKIDKITINLYCRRDVNASLLLSLPKGSEAVYQPVSSDSLSPQLWSIRGDELSSRVCLRLSTAPHKYLVRLTGPCGSLDERLADEMYTLFVDGFDGFEGAMLFGGTRMLRAPDFTEVRHGVTECAPLIRKYNPNCKVLGVVPLDNPPTVLDYRLGTVISRQAEYTTIMHPGQDICLVLQASADKGPDEPIWDAEYRYCARLAQAMREDAGFGYLLVSFGGGGTTGKEIVDIARQGLPVLLIEGFGGKSDVYAHDEAFLARHPNVHVTGPTVESLRLALEYLGALVARPGSKVISLSARRKELA
jgi:hypothetical protein